LLKVVEPNPQTIIHSLCDSPWMQELAHATALAIGGRYSSTPQDAGVIFSLPGDCVPLDCAPKTRLCFGWGDGLSQIVEGSHETVTWCIDCSGYKPLVACKISQHRSLNKYKLL